jgi:hypothetical protein
MAAEQPQSKPLELSATNKLMLAAAKSMLGNLQIKADRAAQRVKIKQDDKIEEYSYEQLAELGEQLFPWD